MKDAPDPLVDRLAATAHELFCEGLRAQGLEPGPVTSLDAGTHAQLTPYGELTLTERGGYVEAARRLLDAARSAGFELMPVDVPVGVVDVDVDALAAADHQRWVEAKSAAGWRYAPKTDHVHKVHSALLPWRALSARDRTRLPDIVAAALGPGELPEAKKRLCREPFGDVPRLLARLGLTMRRAAGRDEGPSREAADARVFISARSTDYSHAQTLYDFLVSSGVTTFFSRESLPELGSADYRKQIDEALDTAEHLVVVTSSAANVQSPWVEAEWGFFINEKRSGRKAGNLVTVIVGGMPPSTLPPSLRYYEVVPFENLDRVLAYVKPGAGAIDPER